MNVYVHKNRVTSRHLGQRRDVPESFIGNVATFRKTSGCSGQRFTERLDFQHCDVPERYISM